MHTCIRNTDWPRHRPVCVAQKNKQHNTSSKDANVTTRSELQSGPNDTSLHQKLYGDVDVLRRTTSFIEETGVIV
ncbi:hypothetical protein DPMN_060528 [Dreissena polymorpha]|uniref:Uncharacterized protein n=1 Tax=Dreissena polymorpha TaxID=45954 RepID=A0A9D4C649_DREPO|nr:hypothetical protein DPMN_060528 [Dreissena polymorpha]